jgi:hypothetical protein
VPSARQQAHDALKSRLAGLNDLPRFRWGTTSTLVSACLVALVFLSLQFPETTQRVLIVLFAAIGAVAVLLYAVFAVPAARFNLLKLLLRWRGWAYDPASTLSRFYLGAVGVLGGSKPTLWELEPCLPPLPVPDLAHTCQLYLSSVEPLLTASEFEQTKRVVADFQAPGGVGETLQAKLVERGQQERNWLIQWWEEFVYLRSRFPIAIYSNWYGLDRVEALILPPVARAANCVHRALLFHEMIETRRLEPNRVQGTVPLSMFTYSRMFGSVRVPGVAQDQLIVHSAQHIVVVSREQYFCVTVYDKRGKLLSAADLQTQLQRCADESLTREPAAQPAVAALTSQNRDVWAKQRDDLIAMDEVNAHTLQMIETALFVLVLDDTAPATMEEMAHIAAHRYGKALWFDKNFNMIVTQNARCLTNVDHTWADAPVMVHMYDFVYSGESSVGHYVKNKYENPALPKPARLEWQLTDETRAQIAVARTHLDGLVQSVDIHVLTFQHFGKDLVKRAAMSPDAFVQAALQLAWYRLTGRVGLTYESGGTVRFAYGRTETVRSLSCDTKRFCELMASDAATTRERFDALRASVKQCVRFMRKATNGDGVDRHLLGLKIIALGAGLALPAIFTDKAYQLPFQLSTSQTTAYASLGGGFFPICGGPTGPEGVGASYVVLETRLQFHITVYKGQTITADAYAEALNKALLDMRDVTLESMQDLDESFSRREFRIQRSE